MNSLKKVFGVAALAFGGAGAVWGGAGLVLGGWSTAGQPGGVDLTSLAVVFTAASAGLFYAGYRAVTASKQPSGGERTNVRDDLPPKL